MVTIAEIDTFIVDIPTIRPHVLAMATMHHQSIVLVRMRDSDGLEGIGEGTTIGGLSYGEESPEGIKLAIDSYIAPVLRTCDPTRVGAAMAKVTQSVFGNHIAKCAVETALLDLAGKRLGVPVSELIGGDASATVFRLRGRWRAVTPRATSRKRSAFSIFAGITSSSSRSASDRSATTSRMSLPSKRRLVTAAASVSTSTRTGMKHRPISVCVYCKMPVSTSSSNQSQGMRTHRWRGCRLSTSCR